MNLLRVKITDLKIPNLRDENFGFPRYVNRILGLKWEVAFYRDIPSHETNPDPGDKKKSPGYPESEKAREFSLDFLGIFKSQSWSPGVLEVLKSRSRSQGFSGFFDLAQNKNSGSGFEIPKKSHPKANTDLEYLKIKYE